MGALNSNITYSFPEEHQIFLLDSSCKDSDKILRKVKNKFLLFDLNYQCLLYYFIFFKADELNLFNQPFRWLIWGKTDYRIFEGFYLRLDSQVFVIEKTTTNTYRIKLLYKLTEHSVEYLDNELAEWEKDQGFTVYKELSHSRNRTNLMGLNLHISYVVTNKDTMHHLEDYRYLKT